MCLNLDVAMDGNATPNLEQFSLRDPDVIAEPWAFYRALHEAGSVWQDAGTGVWLVAGWRLIQEILRDNERFSAVVDRPTLRPGGVPEAVRAIQSTGVPSTATLVGADPPVHDRLRPLVNNVFSAERVERLAPFIGCVIDKLIDGFVADGRCEFVKVFAAPLPLMVIADQLGVDGGQIWKVKEWSDAIIEILGLMGTDESLVSCALKQKEAGEFLLEQVRLRRREPVDSILSALANTRDEGGAYLTDPEVVSILTQLMVAGNETTTNTLSAGILYLARDRALQDRVRAASPKEMRIFVEEILRAESPVQGHYRRAKTDVVVGGVVIPAGAVIQLRYGAANRDESVFPGADRIDLARKNAPQHLAFGGGIHFCVGAMLARKELAMAFRSLLDRLSDITLDVKETSLERVPSSQHRGLLALPIQFKVRS